MSDPFVGEIRIMPITFAPRGWSFCNGQLLPIFQNTALFSILGVRYGGDGNSNFALPNLQGRFPIQAGQGSGLSNYILGQSGGESSVILTTDEIPNHSHTAVAPTVNASDTAGNSTSPTGKVWARYGREGGYSNAPADTQMAAGVSLDVQPVGSGTAHNNLSPFVNLNFIIAMQGVFPPRP